MPLNSNFVLNGLASTTALNNFPASVSKLRLLFTSDRVGVRVVIKNVELMIQ